MERLEFITRADGPPTAELAPGVELRVLVTGSLGAQGVTTSLATFRPSAELGYHQHTFSEVIIVVSGTATVKVAGRTYELSPYDAMHVPAGTPHSVVNGSTTTDAVLHTSMASPDPTRELVATQFNTQACTVTGPDVPECLVRFHEAEVYELAPNAKFRDLFAKRYGSKGICGGYGLFEPGTSLPCHFHAYDESITIVTGEAVCQVAGREYLLSNCGTASVPTGRPHRFLNQSTKPMAMIWVYAGDEPERTLVETGCCDGSLEWPSQQSDNLNPTLG